MHSTGGGNSAGNDGDRHQKHRAGDKGEGIGSGNAEEEAARQLASHKCTKQPYERFDC